MNTYVMKQLKQTGRMFRTPLKRGTAMWLIERDRRSRKTNLGMMVVQDTKWHYAIVGWRQYDKVTGVESEEGADENIHRTLVPLSFDIKTLWVPWEKLAPHVEHFEQIKRRAMGYGN